MPSIEPIVFKVASLDDENDVIKLLKSRLSETNRLTTEAETNIETQGRILFQKIINCPDYDVVLGKTVSGEAVCTASLYLLPMIRRGKHILFIEYVFVHESYRSRGVGKQLMSFIDEYAKNKHAETIKLGTRKTATIYQFYEKQGYHHTDLLMKKDL